MATAKWLLPLAAGISICTDSRALRAKIDYFRSLSTYIEHDQSASSRPSRKKSRFNYNIRQHGITVHFVHYGSKNCRIDDPEWTTEQLGISMWSQLHLRDHLCATYMIMPDYDRDRRSESTLAKYDQL